MKIQREKAFTPVTITLETQEELDKIFAIFNHNTLNKALELGDYDGDLDKCNATGYRKWHSKLLTIIK